MAKVPVDLTQIKPKVVGNFTKRQLVWFPLGGLAGVPVFFLLRNVNVMLAVMVMFVAAFPFFLMAVYQWQGQPIEVFLRYYMRLKKRPAHRPYKVRNFFVELETQYETRREVQEILRGAYERAEKRNRRRRHV